MPDKGEINRQYYGRLYRTRHPLVFRLRGIVSFDQQSKSRLNRRAVGHLLPPGSFGRGHTPFRVLDYGCGWGTFLLGLPQEGVKAYGFDIAEEALDALEEIGRRTGRRIGRARWDEERGLTPAGFDLVVCSHVLEHVDSDERLLSEFGRILNPGGHVLINVPINEVWNDPKHVRRYDAHTLLNRMNATGLQVVEQWQEDRWTSFILTHETGGGRITRLFLRALRALLAILPLSVVEWGERWLPTRYEPQQLLMLGKKPSG